MPPEQKKTPYTPYKSVDLWYNKCKENSKKQAKTLHLEGGYVSIQQWIVGSGAESAQESVRSFAAAYVFGGCFCATGKRCNCSGDII